MALLPVDVSRIRNAWAGRVSGCQLGKAVEVLSILQGHHELTQYLRDAHALPLRDYVPLIEGTLVEVTGRRSCRGEISRSEPDDDINYTVLALMLLERHGLELSTGGRCPRLVAASARRLHVDSGAGRPLVVAIASAIPAEGILGGALDLAGRAIPSASGVSEAISFSRSLVGVEGAVRRIHERYAGLPPAHCLNNLALVV
jgi:hypothetical protein